MTRPSLRSHVLLSAAMVALVATAAAAKTPTSSPRRAARAHHATKRVSPSHHKAKRHNLPKSARRAAQSPSAARRQPVAAAREAPLRVVKSSTMWSGHVLDVAELAGAAPLIVIGRVTNAGRPATAWTWDRSAPWVYRDYQVTPEEYLRLPTGEVLNPGEAFVRVRGFGGIADGWDHRTELPMELKAGQRVLLLLTRNDPFTGQVGPPHWTVLADGAGAFAFTGPAELTRLAAPTKVGLDEMLAWSRQPLGSKP